MCEGVKIFLYSIVRSLSLFIKSNKCKKMYHNRAYMFREYYPKHNM